MIIKTEKELKKWFYKGYEIQIIPIADSLIDFNMATFRYIYDIENEKQENNIMCYSQHFGYGRRTDMTEEKALLHIKKYFSDPGYIVNVSGYW